MVYSFIPLSLVFKILGYFKINDSMYIHFVMFKNMAIINKSFIKFETFHI